MKRFLLYLSALFVGVSFATAQTYEINTANGTLNEMSGKSSVWTANDCPAGLKITATDSNGNAVNTISVLNSGYKFYAVGLYPNSENQTSSPTTYTISVEDGYLIAGYSMTYYPSTGKKVTLSNEYGYNETPSSSSLDYIMSATGLSTKSTTFTVAASSASYAVTILEFTVTVKQEGEGGEESGEGSTVEELYAAIAKPSFGKAGNTTFVKAATLTGGVEAEVAGIQAVAGQACVTNAINVEKGAQFDLNITYKLNWGDLAIYQIENDEATKEYGYYYGSWEPNGSTAKVVQYIVEDGVDVSEVVDEVCTVTFPISISDAHNPGDIVVVRAITGVKSETNNSAFEQNIAEGGYVDFLFVVTEPTSYTLAVGETEWATLYLAFPVEIPVGVEAYIITGVKEENWLDLKKVEGAIPANTGIVVNATADNYTFELATEVTADVEGNLLKGTTERELIVKEAAKAYYVLGEDAEGLVGFYNAVNGDNANEFYNDANRAYLELSTELAAANYGFRFPGTTGISEVTTENVEMKAIFDLTGRRVEEVAAPGIYIVNGVKRVVR